jgi:hypothetical protein
MELNWQQVQSTVLYLSNYKKHTPPEMNWELHNNSSLQGPRPLWHYSVSSTSTMFTSRHRIETSTRTKREAKHAGWPTAESQAGGQETNLDGLPDGVAVGADGHGAPHGPVVRKLGGSDHVRVPRVEVHWPRRDLPLPVPAAGLRGGGRRRARSRRGLAPGCGGDEPRRRQPAPEQGLRRRGEAQQRRHCWGSLGLGCCACANADGLASCFDGWAVTGLYTFLIGSPYAKPARTWEMEVLHDGSCCKMGCGGGRQWWCGDGARAVAELAVWQDDEGAAVLEVGGGQ